MKKHHYLAVAALVGALGFAGLVVRGCAGVPQHGEDVDGGVTDASETDARNPDGSRWPASDPSPQHGSLNVGCIPPNCPSPTTIPPRPDPTVMP